jgi:solute:Na+ symporter, SSS family
MTLLLMLLSAVVTFYMDSIANAWKFLMALGAGTGLVYILRWFWWRINAWSEISAMAAAFITSLVVQIGFGFNTDNPQQFAYTLLITVAVTTTVWIIVTFMTAPEPKEKLLSFYRRVQPNPKFWKPIAAEATDVIPQKDGIFSFLNWISGVIMIYAFLFGTGKIVLGEALTGLLFLAVGFSFGGFIYYNMNKRGWETLAK